MDKPKVTREGLIAAGLCVACQIKPHAEHGVHCKECLMKFGKADWGAFKGMNFEIFQDRRKGML